MGRSTVHYADSETNNILKRLHNKLRPAGTPVQRVEYIIELLLLRIFEVKIQQDPEFAQIRAAFKDENDKLLFSELATLANDQILLTLNQKFFPFYSRILSEARKVWKGNLSTKVQDQLVLIEEVFSNSNFSNNVTSGNMAEIIGLVAELDKDRLLKTDLLGDAIESALSETGGTRDIGLHRTPDHIRQFMVGLAAPTFDDKIFDPTVGTGGFMFDSFEYVMQGVSQDGHWPGPKSHPELAAWFKDWFSKHRVPMPSIETTTDFYRTGVGGIEYLGMVRKMAAINFYVRGLNPGNIQQGDALEKFGTEILPKSKTVIIANPPFGAERDKESYPNVWSEYSTESETTILFVKLMLESLKPGGRCAVIVSEGFLTWDQNSARALRHALLDECNLQAVISLPQGVFVSKNGQGAKTSILCFVKGGRTSNVWFYKVTNDGYTMGTNRKSLPDSQLVEALDYFHQYVREGKEPPESRHSFCIPADWIKVIDPRVKDKIRDETRAEMGTRAAEDKNKLIGKLDAQVVAKKLSERERNDRLAQHDELWQSKIENAIAQKLERAHLFSFNLPNYRSSLTPGQLAAWKDFASAYVREDDPSKTLENQYRAIVASTPDELDALISGLDPRHTLELDIARQFLTGISPELFTKHPHLRTLQEVIASQQKLPRVPLKDLIEARFEKIKKNDYDGSLPIVEKISFGDGKIHFREERKTGMDLCRVRMGDLLTSKINIHQGALALAPCDLVASTHYQPYLFRPSDVLPEFIVHLLRTPQFAALLNEQKNKGIKNEQGADFLGEFAIPVPDSTIQEAAISARSNYINLRDGVALVSDSLDLEVDADLGPTKLLGEAVLETKNGWSPNCDGGDTPVLALSCLKNGVIDLDDVKFTSESRRDIERFYVRSGDFFYSRGNTAELVALAGVVHNVSRDVVFPDLLTRVKFNEEMLLPEFAVWLFNSGIGRKYFGAVPPGAAPSMLKVSQDYMASFPVPLLGKLDKQREIIEKTRVHRQSLEWLANAVSTQQERAARILNQIWET